MNYKISVIKSSKYCYTFAINEVGERIGKLCIDLDCEDVNRYKKVYNGKFAKIILVSTLESVIGQGVATAMMNKVIEVLRDYNLYLNVIPLKRNDKDMDKNGLIEFYKKFGFKKYDADISVTTMIKLAS